MFEKASKLKLRFPTSTMQMSVEDLWDLPLQSARGPSLDAIAIQLSRELKASGEESFVTEQPVGNVTLQLKLDIVKHIITSKMSDNLAKANALQNKQQKDKLLNIIAQKEDESLLGKSVEELKELAKAL